ncbi:MAG TPA: polysaccharide biosynthesis tyrosine autokinase [Hydrogenophaga sp.]|uniref:GumC family protein n=1 Tax=Hydrogenophaga sp. TaxID=1904254 RepID=UPI002C4B90F0|nr:polysaccharide biosynthesis tyrosine autokinase [Hydrogenophaga sp.]HSX95741.1 polysaccharide biosynthesis tyrosine autokinase [Hydrogenophaga sp.]
MATNDQHPLPAGPGPASGLGALALRREAALSELMATQVEAGARAEERIDLKTIWRALVRRKRIIATVTALCTLAAGVYTLQITPQYKSSALLQIDRAAQKVVGFNAEVEVDEGPLADQLQLRTQIELMKSRSLAERVIDELGLYKPDAPARAAAPAAQADVDAPAWAGGVGPVERTMAFLGDAWSRLHALLASPAPDEDGTLSRAATVARFQESLSVEPIRNSRLVQIQVLNPDPQMAATIANAMSRAFIATNIERKLHSSIYARQYLEEQIRQTKAKLEESERVINAYAKKNEILNLGDKGSAAIQTFVDFSTALAKAEQDRIRAETLYNQVKLNPESAPQAVTNEAIRAYKEQRARLEADYAKNRSTFKPEYPAMVAARAQIAELDARIKTEVNNILSSIEGQYVAAKRTEDRLRSKVAGSRSEVLSVQDRSVDMNLLSRELDTNRQVYDSLLQRLKEVNVMAGITANNVSIVDEASPPLFPANPNIKLNLGLGVVLGLFLGMLAALLREQMDDSVKNANDIEARYQLPLLGLIPFTRPERGRKEAVALLAHHEPRSTFAESYRSMRTALQFSTADGAPQRFMVTSCGKSEGKSTTALALAINFAQLGQQVLLIDADMRKGGLHKMLGVTNDRGLSNLLSGDRDLDASVRHTSVDKLALITAGPVPPNPVELLAGPRLGQLLDKAQALGYEQIVIDGPPLLGIADAIVLGNQIQNIVLAIKAGGTRRESIKDALRRLRNAGLAPMGVVFTHALNEHTSDYAYAAYYGHGYAAGERPAPPPAARPEPAPGPVPLPAGGGRIDPTLDPYSAT